MEPIQARVATPATRTLTEQPLAVEIHPQQSSLRGTEISSHKIRLHGQITRKAVARNQINSQSHKFGIPNTRLVHKILKAYRWRLKNHRMKCTPREFQGNSVYQEYSKIPHFAKETQSSFRLQYTTVFKITQCPLPMENLQKLTNSQQKLTYNTNTSESYIHPLIH